MPLTLRVKLVFVVGCAHTIVSMGISAGPEETAKSLHYLHACVRACSCVRACVCVCVCVCINLCGGACGAATCECACVERSLSRAPVHG
jgi:hypothetical protein